MLDIDGMVTVAEAAKQLNLSIEQVRRKLREGKLKGRRVGNQWFVDSQSFRANRRKPEPQVPRELMQEVRKAARRIVERNPGYAVDPVQLVRRIREDE